jgi:methyl-accepting chemotaxis protein
VRQSNYVAQTSVNPENAKMVVDAIKDLSHVNGFGLGVGTLAIIILAWLAFALNKVAKKLDISEIARRANEFADNTSKSLNTIESITNGMSDRTGRSLNDIAEVTAGTDRKVEGISDVIGEIRELQSKATAMGMEMSGRLTSIEDHLKQINEGQNGKVTPR